MMCAAQRRTTKTVICSPERDRGVGQTIAEVSRIEALFRKQTEAAASRWRHRSPDLERNPRWQTTPGKPANWTIPESASIRSLSSARNYRVAFELESGKGAVGSLAYFVARIVDLRTASSNTVLHTGPLVII